MGLFVEKKKVIKNLLWRFAERTGNQLVSLVVSIILARLLTPDIFGTIALVLVIITLLNVFVDSGFGTALIQKKDADDVDFSTVFYFSLAICIVLYAVVYLTSPAIAAFYRDDLLTPVIRVLGLTIVVSGVRNVQLAYVSRTLQFRLFFFSTMSGTLASACVGITTAYCGWGVWALVSQQLTNTVIGTIVLWITVKWRPKKVFSVKRLKWLFDFGWKMLLSSLLDVTYRNVRQLIIGRMYTPSDLGQYNRGEQFPSLITTNINASLDSVLLPVMSSEQDDPYRVKTMTRRSIMTSTYIMAPLMIGLAAIATPLVRLILTEKWLECVPYMMIFCVTYMFYPIHTSNLNAIKAMGRSDLFLRLEIIKKSIGMIALLATMSISVMAMAYSLLVVSFASQIINSWPNKRLLDYGYLEQITDIVPAIVLAVVMGGCVYPIQWFHLSDAITICIQIPLGGVVYIVLSIVFKLEAFHYLQDIMKTFLTKKENI